ncbi:UPF0481 protein At3g47200-like [Camellia sinensis]|uniref:Uncharacterized protein n=1 Tax=Camellia sinensis var. sinensis TaxID=542762 RepID=A0A4S4D273_CAMSN|nr:UPF0481 protein At3g47200-like [Camellia sinensis]THF96352.1 hypothetical protein TEA_012819 [Camellia sinensis var. sinensis]
MESSRNRDHVSLEITEEDEKLALSIKDKMENVSLSHCICKVPEKLFKDNEDMYFPKLVAIGPFHHDDHPLNATKDQKWRYLNTLLNRQPNVEACLNNCVIALKESEAKVRKCYGEKINLNSDDLVTLMLVDGCFIIELLLKFSMKSLRRRDDLFFKSKDTFFRLRCDVFLLENQIPFFILRRLFDIVPIPSQCTQSLIELALSFFKRMIPGDVQALQGKSNQDHCHLLDLVHNCYLPTYLEVHSKGTHKHLHSTTKLQSEGIGFSKAKTESLLDINFVLGVIKIPPLKVHDYTEITFRNLIALENCYVDRSKHVTSYVFLMGSLIQSENDVRMLYRAGILTNGLERKEEIIGLFNKVRVDVDANDYYYKGLCEQVKEYKRSIFKKIKDSYSKTHLAVAWFSLAVLFLVLTFIGTMFSILSFTLHHV